MTPRVMTAPTKPEHAPLLAPGFVPDPRRLARLRGYEPLPDTGWKWNDGKKPELTEAHVAYLASREWELVAPEPQPKNVVSLALWRLRRKRRRRAVS